jgi:hypothetical protein
LNMAWPYHALLPPPFRQDPFNMVWSGTDELKIEGSFKNMRLEVMVC